MGEWLAIAQWQECVKLAKPGVVFEIRNAEGQTIQTQCVQPLPKMPFDWKSAPLQFRVVPEPMPEHSSPLPAPRGR